MPDKGGPVETVSVTAPGGANVIPNAGLCPTTSFAGAVGDDTGLTITVKPSPMSVVRAWVSVNPTKSGMSCG